MPSSLVLDWARKQDIAVPQWGNRHILEAHAPAAIQFTLDSNFIVFSLGGSYKHNLPTMEWIVSVQKAYLDEYSVELRGEHEARSRVSLKFFRSCFGSWLRTALNLVLVKRPECDYWLPTCR